VRRVLAVVMSAAALLLSAPASAHPLGNFTINHLVKAAITPDRLRVKYVLDIAEIPTFQIMRERGIEGPDQAALLDRWATDEIAVVSAGLTVTLDGAPLQLIPSSARASTRPGAGGLPTLYWVGEFSAPLPAAHADRTLTIADAVYRGRIGWKDVVVVPDREPTDELRSYPNALLGSPREINGVSLRLAADGRVLARTNSSSAQAAPAGSTSQIRSNALSDLLAEGAASPWLVLLTLLTAIGLGALHALEPGHGKTLLAVSLVGARATAQQALILAVGLTFAHTAGVLALGLLMLAAAQWIVPENIYPWITLASGAMVAVLGANALSRIIKIRRGDAHAHVHPHHHEGDVERSNGSGMERSNSFDRHGHAHDHSHSHVPPGTAPLSFRSVVLVAMSGNIAPCPAALVVLLAALSLHQLGYGLLVIVAFSVGLAGVLTGLGIALVHGASWLSKRPALETFVRYGPLVSATVIALIGAAMLGQGAAASTLHAPALLVSALVGSAIAGYAFSPGHVHEHEHDQMHAGATAHALQAEAP